ncbi:hypothetical protein [Sphingomonas gellani]|nr:hypothetical protein [Sphingomonas gellani]
MASMSKLALAAALSAGIAAPALFAPAAAAKKEEAKPGYKLSPAVLKVAKPAQDALQANDLATAETNIAAVEAGASTDDDKYVAAALRYDLEQRKLAAAQQANPNAALDETKLAGPLATLYASPNTAPDAKARYAYRLGALNYNSKKYAAANQYLQQAQQLGYKDPNLPLLLVKSKIEGGDVKGGLADLSTVIEQTNASGQKAPEDYYRYGISRANAAKLNPETMTWLTRYVQAYPTAKNWRDVAIMFGLQQGSIATLDKDQKLDVYRLLRMANALADQAHYLDYAQTTRDRGLPGETVAVVQEGIAKGKVPNDANTKAFLATATAAAKAEGSLSGLEAKAKSAADGKLASQTGDGYLGQGNWTKAAELYRLALSKGAANADAVNTHLGIALTHAGDKAGAQAAFAAVKTQPRADIAALWTAYLNQSAA